MCGFGGDNFRRASQTVKRHENSQCHRDASDVYFRHLNRNDIASLIPQWLQTAKSSSRDKVKKNREVLNRIIDIVKYISQANLRLKLQILFILFQMIKQPIILCAFDCTTDAGNISSRFLRVLSYPFNGKFAIGLSPFPLGEFFRQQEFGNVIG